MADRFYFFTWEGGGYNTCFAPNKGEAVQAAVEMAKGTSLVPNVDSFVTGPKALALTRKFDREHKGRLD